MSDSLKDKVVVITGSTRGIGLAGAKACAEAGGRVVISSRKQDAVDREVAALSGLGLTVSGFAADVAEDGALQALLGHAEERFGKVDVWVNNAGLSSGYRPLDELSEDEVRYIVDVNVTATACACRLLVPYFVANGGGILLNMSGRGGRGDPAAYTALYAATKAAVTSLTKSVAIENRSRRVSIHALLPGMVATDFYTDMEVSPRLQESVPNVYMALEAMGVPLDVVGAKIAEIAAQEPGAETGRVYSLLSGGRMVRGIAKLSYWRATGRLKPEP